MKKLTVILFILLFGVSLAFAEDTTVPVKKENDQVALLAQITTAYTVPGGADDCSGDLMWSAHFEGVGAVGTTFDVTTGTPAGCVDTAGDKTITYYNSMANANDGSFTIVRPAAAANYAQSPFTGCSSTAMSVKFDVWVDTFNDGEILQALRYDSNNIFYVYMLTSAGQRFEVIYVGNGTTKIKASSVTFVTGQWYTIHAQFQKGTSPYLRIGQDSTYATYTTADLTAFTNVPNTVRLGNNAATAGAWKLRNVYVYTGWQTGTEWGD